MRLLISLVILISTAYCADFTTYIGGANQNPYVTVAVAALATDSARNTYVTGNSAFVTKLDPTGNIVFTASISPSGSYGNAIAVDPAGNVWLGGQTVATNFPLVNALQSSSVYSGTGFLVKMAPDGTVLYSSYFGGALGSSGVNGVATDHSGNVYVTGFTGASDFPTTPGLPASPVSGGSTPVYGLFATKLNSTGQKIIYSTLIAGPANCAFCFPVPSTMGIGIAVDGAGNALVAGDTDTTDLPVKSIGNSEGAFVFKINAAGSELNYFTYLGSGASVGNFDSPDTAAASPIAADASGNAYIAGYTNSPDFPTTAGAYQTAYTAGNNPEGFAMKLNPAGMTVWATFLGGSNASMANAISLDSSDNVWLTGMNGTMFAPGGDFVDQLSADGSALPYSAQFPAGGAGQDIAVDASGVLHVAASGGLISTITPAQPLASRVLSILNAAAGATTGLIAPGEVISLYGLGLGPTTPVGATPENGLFPTSLGGVQVLINGTAIPLLYVSASQINAEIPSPLNGAENGIAVLKVMNNSMALPAFRVAVVNSEFAVFTKAGGSMAVINQDGTVNKLANPAKPGSIVSIWATGFGSSGPPANGAVAAGANNYCSSCQLILSDGKTQITETAQYAGAAPGLIDVLMQINFMIPTLLSDSSGGGWVNFTPPGYTYPIQLGWVEVAQ
jgi:uncharacterized protein (TIGR03437 family)